MKKAVQINDDTFHVFNNTKTFSNGRDIEHPYLHPKFVFDCDRPREKEETFTIDFSENV